MATTYEPCKDIINIQMETRKRKIQEKAYTKRIGEQRNGNSETVQRNRRKKNTIHTHTQSPIEHVDRLYFNSISMCRLYHIGSWAKMTFVLYTIYIPSIEAQRMNLKAIAKNARTRTDARAPYTQLHMTRIRLFSADFDERTKNSTTKPMHISS